MSWFGPILIGLSQYELKLTSHGWDSPVRKRRRGKKAECVLKLARNVSKAKKRSKNGSKALHIQQCASSKAKVSVGEPAEGLWSHRSKVSPTVNC